ncbi:MAG TPA: M48 family metallopeptidase [Anaerolineales bacterium]|nr:M48 family metallopeptidase [Anaerolineales bacterium]
MTTPILDPEKQVQARQYARIRRRVWLVETVLSALYLAAWLVFGWAKSLAGWLRAFTANEWLLVLGFAVLFGGISGLLELPLEYYSGFALPHRFGQSNQDLKGWAVDQLKGLAISAPLGLLVLELVYLALRLTGGWWWLWTGAGMLIFTVVLSNLAPVLIMPLFNKFVPLGEEHAELADRLMKLAENAHARVRGVFKFDMSKRTKAANAALTGIGNTRRIVLGDTLIDEFTTDEIETVLAHELGHHVHKDIPLLIGFGTLLTLGGLYLASLGLDWAAAHFGFSGPADIAGLPALAIVLGAFGLVTQPLDNAFSRWRERLADEYALQSTGKAQAFASAFVRLANQNLGEVDPEKWVVFMFYDHPPVGERIKRAENWTA